MFFVSAMIRNIAALIISAGSGIGARGCGGIFGGFGRATDQRDDRDDRGLAGGGGERQYGEIAG